jgi:hypothetical protein
MTAGYASAFLVAANGRAVLRTLQICAFRDDLLHGKRRRTTSANDLDIVRSARILIRTEEGRRATVTTEEASCRLRSHSGSTACSAA